MENLNLCTSLSEIYKYIGPTYYKVSNNVLETCMNGKIALANWDLKVKIANQWELYYAFTNWKMEIITNFAYLFLYRSNLKQ